MDDSGEPDLGDGLNVSVGTFAAGGFRELLDQLHYAGYIFVGVIAVFLIGIFVVKKLLEKSEARHMQNRPAEDLDGPVQE